MLVIHILASSTAKVFILATVIKFTTLAMKIQYTNRLVTPKQPDIKHRYGSALTSLFHAQP